MKRAPLSFLLLCLTAAAYCQTDNVDYIRQIAQEDSLIREEMRFNMDGAFMPLRGMIQTFTHKSFRNVPGPYVKRDNHWGDWALGLSPLAATWTLKAFGVKSRSTTQRMVTANGLALGLTVGLSQTLRWTVSEERPDGTGTNSLPSMHTAVAFMGATVLSREYGHISPWVTIGGYAAATGTQMLRINHNAHWMNDIFMGAGIGVVSTNIAYWLTDQMLGSKGINRMGLSNADLYQLRAAEYRPSGFRLVSGTEIRSRNMDVADFAEACEGFSLQDVKLQASASMTTGVEAEWFVSDHLSLSAIGRCSVTQLKLEIPDNAITAWGEQLYVYHGNAAVSWTTLLPKHKRFGARAIGGIRYNEGKTFHRVGPDHQLGAPLLSIQGQLKPELGAGIVVDMMQAHNQTVGFTFDFLHTFGTHFMANRWVIGSSWKAMF